MSSPKPFSVPLHCSVISSELWLPQTILTTHDQRYHISQCESTSTASGSQAARLHQQLWVQTPSKLQWPTASTWIVRSGKQKLSQTNQINKTQMNFRPSQSFANHLYLIFLDSNGFVNPWAKLVGRQGADMHEHLEPLSVSSFLGFTDV